MLRIAEPQFTGKEVEYVNDALQKRSLSMGEYVRRFEELVAASMNALYAVSTTSGTTALHAALLALGVKPGDRVVVPACSYIATANAVRYCGAVPVFVDVDPQTWTLDPDGASKALAGAVGVITVDLYGVRCEVPRLAPHQWVLQDACEAHGVHIYGDAAVLSFYGNKIVTCGEGGAVVTNSSPLANAVALKRGQGTTGVRRYHHEVMGYNYRLTDLQAALGCAQMEQLTGMLNKRSELRRMYDRQLLGHVETQKRRASSADWVYPILVDNADDVAARLEHKGIETRPVFPPLHLQPQYKDAGLVLKVSESLARKGLLLPLHCGMGAADVERVCDAVKEVA